MGFYGFMVLKTMAITHPIIHRPMKLKTLYLFRVACFSFTWGVDDWQDVQVWQGCEFQFLFV